MTISKILTVAAVSAPWWSVSSFWNSLSALQWAAAISALILTIGAVIEYWIKLKALAFLASKWICWKSTTFERCTFRKMLIHSIGPLLVTFGIAGDFIFEGRAFILEDKQEEQARNTLGSLQEKENAVSEEAGALTKRLDGLNTKVGAAETLARNAETEAKQAKGTALDVAGKTVVLKSELSTAEATLNEVDNKRAELETSLRNLANCTAPRVIPDWSVLSISFLSPNTMNASILPFNKWKALIEYVPNDAEARRAALDLAKAFGVAGWDVSPPKPSSEELPDGVKVQRFENSADDFLHNVADLQSENNGRDVAAVVVNFLHLYNWEAEIGWQSQEDVNRRIVPPQGIRILVGLYPPVWFVAPPAMKDVAAVIAKLRKERDEREQAAEQARRDSNAKLFARVSPEYAERLRAQEKLLEQESKAALQPYTSPCQPLEPLDLHD